MIALPPLSVFNENYLLLVAKNLYITDVKDGLEPNLYQKHLCRKRGRPT